MRRLLLAIAISGICMASDSKPAAHGAEAKPAAAKPAAHGAEAKPVPAAKPAEAKHGEAKPATAVVAAKPSPAPKPAEHVAPPKPMVKAAVRPVVHAAAKPKPVIRTRSSINVNSDDHVAPNAVPVAMQSGAYPSGSYVLVPAASFMAAQGAVPVQLMVQAIPPPTPAHDAHVLTPVRTSPAAIDAHATAPHVPKHVEPPVVSAEKALEELHKGNTNHVKGHYKHEHMNHNRLMEVAKGQKPHAIILSCADSRVPPEVVFDKGLGDLFVIRVAGNIAESAELASIEYAAEHLNVPLVVVMGHKRCGAIQAAAGTGDPGGHITDLVKQIQPSVNRARSMAGDLVDNAVHTNIEDVVKNLRRSQPILNQMVESGRLRIVGAYYDLDTGKVDWLY